MATCQNSDKYRLAGVALLSIVNVCAMAVIYSRVGTQVFCTEGQQVKRFVLCFLSNETVMTDVLSQ